MFKFSESRVFLHRRLSITDSLSANRHWSSLYVASATDAGPVIRSLRWSARFVNARCPFSMSWSLTERSWTWYLKLERNEITPLQKIWNCFYFFRNRESQRIWTPQLYKPRIYTPSPASGYKPQNNSGGSVSFKPAKQAQFLCVFRAKRNQEWREREMQVMHEG